MAMEHAPEMVAMEEQSDAAVSYTNIEALLEHGIAAADIEKLNAEGYHTVESIAHATVRKLSEVKVGN